MKQLADLRGKLIAVVEGAQKRKEDRQPVLAQAQMLVASEGAVVIPIVTLAGAKILLVTKRGIRALDVPNLTSELVTKTFGILL